MPVSPPKNAENKLAAGEPVISLPIFFGAPQGLQTHLRLNGLSMRSKSLLPVPFAKIIFPLLVISGAAVGGFLGFQYFGDDQLIRLRVSTTIDRLTRTDTLRYVPKEHL